MVSGVHQLPRESGPDRTASDDENIDVVLAHDASSLFSGRVAGLGQEFVQLYSAADFVEVRSDLSLVELELLFDRAHSLNDVRRLPCLNGRGKYPLSDPKRSTWQLPVRIASVAFRRVLRAVPADTQNRLRPRPPSRTRPAGSPFTDVGNPLQVTAPRKGRKAARPVAEIHRRFIWDPSVSATEQESATAEKGGLLH
ncbi:hypothetical protein QNN03_36315 [Streptomyces sp. GXMU-J15]|uniref:Uncharacterized protein n=1 Tax=Streptomyces fuscus TaxID=3048495 RepID=A0ABT7JAL0_9ACTN|nr:hypothetical protein [Streptomyces fuscus]MDL2081904.1 hypothetical protein [Streptomyces fuscus]